MNRMKDLENRFGADKFTAGLTRRLYDHNEISKEMNEYKERLKSDEFKQNFDRLTPQIQQNIERLIPVAERNGSLPYLVGFVCGYQHDNPLWFKYLEDHIRYWDNREKLIESIENRAKEFKQRYGYDMEVDFFITKAKTLDDSALSYVYDVLSGALVNPTNESREEVGRRLFKAISVLNAW